MPAASLYDLIQIRSVLIRDTRYIFNLFTAARGGLLFYTHTINCTHACCRASLCKKYKDLLNILLGNNIKHIMGGAPCMHNLCHRKLHSLITQFSPASTLS